MTAPSNAPAFAAPSALTSRFGPIGEDQATFYLEEASNLIRGLTRQQLDYVEDDTVVCDPHSDGSILLPELPVLGVSEVAVRHGGAWTPYPERWVHSRTGRLVAVRSAWWPEEPGTVRVTYTHGYQRIPGDLASTCVRLAALAASNPDNVKAQTVGGVSVRFDLAAGDIPPTDQLIIDRYTVITVA